MYIPKNWQQLRIWLKTELGQYILQQEINNLSKVLTTSFGSNILIVGEPDFCVITRGVEQQYKNLIKFNIHPIIDADQQLTNTICINSRQDKLPISSDSMDVVILPHALEMLDNLYEIITESYRVLKPGGKIIVIGFKPYGIWHIWKIIASIFKAAPWRNIFISPHKIIKFLISLGMEEEQIFQYCCNLPVNSTKILDKLLWLEKINTQFFRFGNIYTICANKRVVALTPNFVSEWTEIALNDDLAKST